MLTNLSALSIKTINNKKLFKGAAPAQWLLKNLLSKLDEIKNGKP